MQSFSSRLLTCLLLCYSWSGVQPAAQAQPTYSHEMIRTPQSDPFGSYRMSVPADQHHAPYRSDLQTPNLHAPKTVFQQVSTSEPIPQLQAMAEEQEQTHLQHASLSTYLGDTTVFAPSSIPAFPNPTAGRMAPIDSVWDWTIIPHDLIFQSFAGGPREPRMSSMIVHSNTYGWVWELEAGARVGVLRYGSRPGHRPEGWQLDVEGAAFPRLNFEHALRLDTVDFKVGVPITYGRGPWQWEFTWYHISAHVGDEFLLENPGFNRLDYLRDAFTTALSYYATDDLRLYGEIEYAYNTNDGAEPWHLQFGVDYSPACPNVTRTPTPFFAANAQLREEVNFGGGFNVFAGLQWRGASSNKVLRIGGQYYNGESFQFSFYDEHEELIGLGIMYEF